jgi:DNA-directed RNA polymerase subunit RPC12/RpoP
MEKRFKFECICGQHLVARESMVGTKVHCPACREGLIIPAPDRCEAVDESQYERTERYAVVCTCGHQMLVKAEAAGHTIHCANCGKAIALPSLDQLRGGKTPALTQKDLEGDELTTTDMFLLVDDEEGPGTDIM